MKYAKKKITIEENEDDITTNGWKRLSCLVIKMWWMNNKLINEGWKRKQVYNDDRNMYTVSGNTDMIIQTWRSQEEHMLSDGNTEECLVWSVTRNRITGDAKCTNHSNGWKDIEKK